MRIASHIMLLVVLVATLLASVVLLRAWRGRVLAGELRRQMLTATDAELPSVFEHFAEVGDNSLPLAAEALGSLRPSLAFAARAYLQQYLDKIEGLLPAARSPHLTQLSTALAAQSADYGPTASQWSAEMASQMLRLAPDDDEHHRGQLLSACETLIRHAARDASADVRLAQQALAAEHAPHDPRQPPLAEARAAKLDENWIVRQLAKYDTKPGGGLPLPSVEVPALPLVPEPPIADEAVDDRTPRPFAKPKHATEIDEHPARLPGDTHAAPMHSEPHLNAPVQIGGFSDRLPPRTISSRVQANSADDKTAVEPLAMPVAISDRTTLDIIHEWSDQSPDQREPLAAELRRRGFRDRDFRLAEKLTDSDPAIRQKLAELLPRLSGVHASPWLWWLAEDVDANVRLTAVSLLATSSGPTVRGRLRTLADRESNSRVAAQLRKILAPRSR